MRAKLVRLVDLIGINSGTARSRSPYVAKPAAGGDPANSDAPLSLVGG